MLKIIYDKAGYVVIGSRHMLRQVPQSLQSVHARDKTLASVSSARNIGVIFGSELSMEQQVTHVCRMCYVGLREISKIRPYLTDEDTKPLVVALVMSNLDCNNALLYKISKFLQNILQSVQNNAAKVTAMKRKSDQIEHIRKELHWLPIEFQIKCKLLLLTFKCLTDLA